MGAIIKRRPATSSTSGDAKEAKGSVDIEYERNNTIMLANTDRIVSAAGSKQSILSHVSRGVATSELSLKINNVLLPTQLAEYHYIKKRVIGMLDATHECPALTSTGWALLGLLLIDGIVRRRRLLENHISGSDKTVQSESQIAALEQQWEVKIRKQVPFRAEGTRQQEGVVSIDEHELRLLRAFFDEL